MNEDDKDKSESSRLLWKDGDLIVEQARPSATALSSQAIELLNRSEFVAPFVRAKFIPYLPEFDLGVDFILYREDDDLLFKVQLKGRWTVDGKYSGRDIWIAFRSGEKWFLLPHDRMVDDGRVLHETSESWKRKLYHKSTLPAGWDQSYAPFEVNQLLAGLDADKVRSLKGNISGHWFSQTSGDV